MDKQVNRLKYYLPWDTVPIDISFVFEHEKPAGKHGFLKAAGKKFIFEDGTPVRFWGTNINSGACFPPKEHAPKLARRLAMQGLNIVRFHQMDGEWARPNIFQYAKGPQLKNTQSFDSRSLDLLDYFIACLKEEGIYVYMDFLTYRRFRAEDGVENASELIDGAKPYCLFNRRLIELQKKFIKDLMTHVNPYTGLAYLDDPCIVLSEFVNESSLHVHRPLVEPYRHELAELYRSWAAGQGLAKKSDAEIDFDTPDRDINDFFHDLFKSYITEMMAFAKDLGIKYPLTGSNQAHAVGAVEAHADCDFMDNHEYIWLDTQGRITNKNPLQHDSSFGTMLSLVALPDKPLFISEWDSCWPNEYRAAATLHLAGIMGLQDWGGATIHTYRYGNNVEPWLTSRLGRDLVLGGSYGRGSWDNYNDPAKFGLFYHAALIVRRSDVRPADKEVIVDAVDRGLKPYTDDIAGLRFLPEQHQIKIQLPGRKLGDGPTVAINEARDTGAEIRSDTGQMYRNKKLGNGWIDTERTKVVYGMRRREESVELSGFSITASNDFYTLALSALDEQPISSSQNMLLTAVGRAENKGARYDAARTYQIDEGSGPLEIEVIKAELTLATSQTEFQLLAIDYEGFASGVQKLRAKDGSLSFSIGLNRDNSSMYYLLQKI